MADDDDDLNDFRLPPGTNEDADAQLDKKAIKLVSEYVGSLDRSKNENTIRADIRENIVKLGINGLAFQHELTAQKIMDKEDRADYMRGRKRMARVFASEEGAGLLKADQEAVKARKAKKREKDARAAAKAGGETPDQQERRIAADNNPRSDPKSGGAGKPKAKGKAALAIEAAEAASAQRAKLQGLEAQSGAKATMQGADAHSDAALAESIAAVNAAEQAEGDAILKDAGKPKSQSQISQEKLAEAKL